MQGVKTLDKDIAIVSSEDFGYPGYYSQTDAIAHTEIKRSWGTKKVQISTFRASDSAPWNYRYRLDEVKDFLCNINL